MNIYLRLSLPFLLFVATDVPAQRCQEINEVDFRNGIIEIPSTPKRLDKLFRFRNGVFDETEVPGDGVEWRFRISKDVTERPDPHTTIRFIQISGDHLRGTGSRNYVLGLQCADGVVKNIFEREDEGLTLVSATSGTVSLRTPVWKNSDAHCCPSGEKQTWFVWDKVSGRYVEKEPLPRQQP
jgi:hypothetical protein